MGLLSGKSDHNEPIPPILLTQSNLLFVNTFRGSNLFWYKRTKLIGFSTNAIKYSPENTEVELNTQSENGILKIEITDEGPGIDSKYQQRIFERYFKIPGNTNNGTGLGLRICKEFMEAQGDAIGVKNNDSGIGCTFYIEV